jgi:acyl-CoA thioesterase I
MRLFHARFTVDCATAPIAARLILAFCLLLLPAVALACPKSAQGTPPSLPASRAALAQQRELVVVALGSSSTRSWMSSDPAHSYPAVLQAELSAMLPAAHVAVINRGINGQDAPQELARLVPDVIAVRPSLVIWQVGTNGALDNADPAVFSSEVAKGVAMLRAAGIDVILMDDQRSPRVLAAPDHLPIEHALAEVATDTGVNLFARTRLMDGWQQGGAPYARFVSTDGLHLNDLGYSCVAKALAVSIASGLRAPVMMADVGVRMPRMVRRAGNAIDDNPGSDNPGSDNPGGSTSSAALH